MMFLRNSSLLWFAVLLGCQTVRSAAEDSASSWSTTSLVSLLDRRRLDERDDNPSERDAYELVAFLLWYIFLVLCCVVPTCCAYRRRRLVEQRMAQQQETFARMQENNFFFLSTLTQRQNGDVVQAERTRILTDALKDNTMTVKESDLDTLPESERPSWSHGEIVSMHGGPEDSPNANEYDIEENEDNRRVLALPPDGPNANRKVAGVCAICLCAYETGDVVAWSAEESCKHAFHKDCLVPWLAKKTEPHCPVCRQAFCKVNYNEINGHESLYESPFTFSQSFSQALARARLEASLMSRIESGGLDGDLEIVHMHGGTGGDPATLRSSWITAAAAVPSTRMLSPRTVAVSSAVNNSNNTATATQTNAAESNPTNDDTTANTDENSPPMEAPSNPTAESSDAAAAPPASDEAHQNTLERTGEESV